MVGGSLLAGGVLLVAAAGVGATGASGVASFS
jgi:hypothetical protein